MRIAFAVFVKTPGLSPIKTRLASTIGRDAADRFYLDSLSATVNTVEKVKTILAAEALVVNGARRPISVAPFWAVAEEAGQRSRLWRENLGASKGWPILIQRGDGLGERMASVFGELKYSHDIVCLYGADSPHVKAEVLADALRKLLQANNDEFSGPAPAIAVGPTEDGGFYFLASRLPIAREIWCSVTYSTEKTWLDLRAALIASKLSLGDTAAPAIFEIEKNFDIDTAEDFARLEREKPNWRSGQ